MENKISKIDKIGYKNKPNQQPQTGKTHWQKNFSKSGLLLVQIFVVSTCSLIYELLIGTTTTNITSNSVLAFSLAIGLFLAGLGSGAFFSSFVKDRFLISTFVLVESFLALIGGFSVVLLYGALVFSPYFTLVQVILTLLIGFLSGLEIPILTRILNNSQKFQLSSILAKVLSFDYLGGLAASLLFPLLLLPYFGLVRLSFVTGIVNCLMAILALAIFWKELKTSFLGRWGHSFLIFLILAILIFGTIWSSFIYNFLESQLYRDPIIYSTQTPYQRVVLTKKFRDIRLFLNGGVQFSSLDEYRYHESLVMPAMVNLLANWQKEPKNSSENASQTLFQSQPENLPQTITQSQNLDNSPKVKNLEKLSKIIPNSQKNEKIEIQNLELALQNFKNQTKKSLQFIQKKIELKTKNENPKTEILLDRSQKNSKMVENEFEKLVNKSDKATNFFRGLSFLFGNNPVDKNATLENSQTKSDIISKINPDSQNPLKNQEKLELNLRNLQDLQKNSINQNEINLKNQENDNKNDNNLQKYAESVGKIENSENKTPKLKIVVFGGGDGLAVREILKFDKYIEKIWLVDIDKEITNLAANTTLLANLNQNSLKNPKVEVINADAWGWIQSQKNDNLDLIISDFPDPDDNAIAKLYSQEFYRFAHQKLTKNGLIVTQSSSPYTTPKAFWGINQTLKSVFAKVLPYTAYVPSFGLWGFQIASKNLDFEPTKINSVSNFLQNQSSINLPSKKQKLAQSFETSDNLGGIDFDNKNKILKNSLKNSSNQINKRDQTEYISSHNGNNLFAANSTRNSSFLKTLSYLIVPSEVQNYNEKTLKTLENEKTKNQNSFKNNSKKIDWSSKSVSTADLSSKVNLQDQKLPNNSQIENPKNLEISSEIQKDISQILDRNQFVDAGTLPKLFILEKDLLTPKLKNGEIVDIPNLKINTLDNLILTTYYTQSGSEAN